MKKTNISVSVLDADFAKIGETVQEIEAGGADSIHLDVMDGHFVRNLSFGPGIIKSIRKLTDLEFEAHLMIENPAEYLEKFADSGCDSLIVHLESARSIDKVLESIGKLGLSSGIAVNPATKMEDAIEAMGMAEKLLVMTVNPGYGGQAFMPGSLERVKRARMLIDELDLDVKIGVDGGIDKKTGADAVDAGADFLVAGSSLLKSKSIRGAIRELRKT